MTKKEFEKLTPDQVLELINQTSQELAKADEKIQEQDNLIVELNQKLTAAESTTGKVSKPTVEVKKVNYTVNSGAHLDRSYTAAEIAENPKVAAMILEMDGQTILTKEA